MTEQLVHAALREIEAEVDEKGTKVDDALDDIEENEAAIDATIDEASEALGA